MNLEKLKRLQAQVRIGGKGTPRRKKKVLHQLAANDDKKLQSALKKLSVSTIPGIEEVNIIKDDLTVIHFNNPKAQASLSANTFAVTGLGDTKKVVDMLPDILPQLGQETVVQLRMFANTIANNQKQQQATEGSSANQADENDDDNVPTLVSDFDEFAKIEAAKQKEKTIGDSEDVPKGSPVAAVNASGETANQPSKKKNSNKKVVGEVKKKEAKIIEKVKDERNVISVPVANLNQDVQHVEKEAGKAVEVASQPTVKESPVKVEASVEKSTVHAEVAAVSAVPSAVIAPAQVSEEIASAPIALPGATTPAPVVAEVPSVAEQVPIVVPAAAVPAPVEAPSVVAVVPEPAEVPAAVAVTPVPIPVVLPTVVGTPIPAVPLTVNESATLAKTAPAPKATEQSQLPTHSVASAPKLVAQSPPIETAVQVTQTSAQVHGPEPVPSVEAVQAPIAEPSPPITTNAAPSNKKDKQNLKKDNQNEKPGIASKSNEPKPSVEAAKVPEEQKISTEIKVAEAAATKPVVASQQKTPQVQPTDGKDKLAKKLPQNQGVKPKPVTRSAKPGSQEPKQQPSTQPPLQQQQQKQQQSQQQQSTKPNQAKKPDGAANKKIAPPVKTVDKTLAKPKPAPAPGGQQAQQQPQQADKLEAQTEKPLKPAAVADEKASAASTSQKPQKPKDKDVAVKTNKPAPAPKADVNKKQASHEQSGGTKTATNKKPAPPKAAASTPAAKAEPTTTTTAGVAGNAKDNSAT